MLRWWIATHATPLLSRLVGSRIGRVVVLGQTHGRPSRMTADHARKVIGAITTSPGFEATLEAAAHRQFRTGAAINAPVTLAFGARDLLLRRQSRRLDELPEHTRIAAELPGCGHVPMSDAPGAVAELIVSSALGSGSAAV